MTQIAEVAVAESDPFYHFDLVVGTFREAVRVRAVKGVQDVLGPVSEDTHQGFEFRKINGSRIQGEFVKSVSCLRAVF